MKTTLNKIRGHGPCISGWAKLLKNLGKAQADDEPLAITTILESNGLDDALWCLRAVDGYQREMRMFAVACARSVQHLMKDKRSIDAIDVSERHANGLAMDNELADASSAAWAAAWSAERDAERDAAWAAERSATWSATWSAARDAAWAAAWSAIWAAERDAAWAAEREIYATYLCIICAEIEQGEAE